MFHGNWKLGPSWCTPIYLYLSASFLLTGASPFYSSTQSDYPYRTVMNGGSMSRHLRKAIVLSQHIQLQLQGVIKDLPDARTKILQAFTWPL
jgi:hypothetical protein